MMTHPSITRHSANQQSSVNQLLQVTDSTGKEGWNPGGARQGPQGPKALTLHHAPVGSVCDGIDVGWHLVPLLALVHLHDLL